MAASLKRLTIIVVVTLSLAACSTLRTGGGFGDRPEGFAAGSALAGQLSGADQAALASAFARAMETGAAQQWRGRRANGVVEPGGYALANLMADPHARIGLAHGGLDYGHVMETDLGLFVVTRNSNIRLGPGTNNKIAEVLPSGSGVEVVGRVVDKSWMLVAVDDRVRGFIFRDLLIKAPGTELELAGGPRRRPVLCRQFTQRINMLSAKDTWRGAACNDGAGWRVAPPIPGPTLLEDELL